ncbi:MAG: L-2-hydroxyglutarate oxidase [Gammaproteobacteria bacterium]|nr:L-2-hydroxyglutarate oxidase [Gammaproteobacteria bacterium]
MIRDVIIIGGGIVGASTAWQLKQRFPGRSVLLLEKEAGFGFHQTGHNSGVIHAGVYYEPGSLKARFCREGLTATLGFCRREGIPHEQCGKLIVAVEDAEFSRLEALYDRCWRNGVRAERLDAVALREREPNVDGRAAIFVPETGIVDYGAVCRRMLEKFRAAGGQCRTNTEVTAIREDNNRVEVATSAGSFQGERLVACAGLMSDRLALEQGLKIDFRIVPVRGEFYRLPDNRRGFIKHLIYPVPDPALPFVGVHLTRTVDGGITVGPNAVLGWKREGYGQFNFNAADALDVVRFPGFWKLAARHWRHGISEYANALWKRGYLKQVQRLCPELTLDDLLPHPAGIRAQAVKTDGTLAHDFLFAESPRSLHVCNAPSPAATSAIPIGAHICDKIDQV